MRGDERGDQSVLSGSPKLHLVLGYALDITSATLDCAEKEVVQIRRAARLGLGRVPRDDLASMADDQVE